MEALQNFTILPFPNFHVYEQARSTNISTVVCSVLLLIAALYITMGGILSKNHMPVDGKTVMVTGASEGMGRSVAKMLAARGANVILVSRSESKLEEALAEVKSAAVRPTQRFTFFAADVSQPSFAPPLMASATAWNSGIPPDIVWCVAGMSIPGLFASQDFSVVRRQMDVNFYGEAEMAHAAMRAWLAAAPEPGSSSSPSSAAPLPPRHLVFTSSVAAFYTIVGYGSYAPSKWALRGLCDSIAQDAIVYRSAGLADIRVATVFPGTILSPGLERENSTKPAITHELEKDDPRQTPDAAARAALAGLERGRYQVAVSWLGHLMRWGVLGGVERNNWLLDIVMAWVVSLAWVYVQWDQNSRIRAFGRKEGRAVLGEGWGKMGTAVMS